MRLLDNFGKFRKQSAAHRCLLIEALLWLLIARLAILTIPFRWIARVFSLGLSGEPAVPDQNSRQLARNIGWALTAAASRTPWASTCLTQALAGSAMLRQRAIPATLTMGVAKTSPAAKGLEAHAWLSCNGVVLTGSGEHERFSVIATFIATRREISVRHFKAARE